MIGRCRRVRDFGFPADKGENFELKPAQFFESQAFEERATGVGEVMLHRIAQREETPARALQSVSERDQFLPAVDANPPTIAQIAGEFFGVDIEIGDVRIAPDKRMERLDVGNGRAIFFAAVNLDGPSVAQLDRDDPRRRVGAEEERIFLESHGPATTRRSRVESSDGASVPSFFCSCSCS